MPEASQIGIEGGAASLTDGFPPLNFTPISAGGVPPFGEDMNGILNQTTAWNRWLSAGGPILYDATFQAAIGGYPNGAIVGSLVVQGNYWMSTVDGNTTNPDTGGAGWVTPPGMMGTGHWQHRPVAATLTGWLISNGTTIGSASSTSGQRSNADCWPAFNYLWSNFSNTQCPVSGGRGASAAADFAANKVIATLDMRGIGIMGVDAMGSTSTGLLASVPVVSGSVTLPGSIVGENLHTLINAELPVITPLFTGTLASYTVTSTRSDVVTGAIINAQLQTGTTFFNLMTSGSAGASAITSNGNNTPAGIISSFGSGTAHNNVERSILVYWYMKL